MGTAVNPISGNNSGALPPPPPGYTLVAPTAPARAANIALPPPPPGYTLVVPTTPVQPAPTQPATPQLTQPQAAASIDELSKGPAGKTTLSAKPPSVMPAYAPPMPGAPAKPLSEAEKALNQNPENGWALPQRSAPRNAYEELLQEEAPQPKPQLVQAPPLRLTEPAAPKVAMKPEPLMEALVPTAPSLANAERRAYMAPETWEQLQAKAAENKAARTAELESKWDQVMPRLIPTSAQTAQTSALTEAERAQFEQDKADVAAGKKATPGKTPDPQGKPRVGEILWNRGQAEDARKNDPVASKMQDAVQDFASGLSRADQAALMAALGAKNMISKMATVYFAYQGGKAALQGTRAAAADVEAGNRPQAAYDATAAVLNGVMAGWMTKHGAHEAAETIRTGVPDLRQAAQGAHEALLRAGEPQNESPYTIVGHDAETGLPIMRRRAGPEPTPLLNEAGGVPRGTVGQPPAHRDGAAMNGAQLGEHPPIGTVEPETGRPVLQQSPRAEVNQAAATAEHPDVKAALEQLTADIPGAKVSGARAEKEPERRDEKIEDEGQSPRTVRDYSGYRIAVDTPQARDQVAAALKQSFEVHGEQNQFDAGDPEHGFHAYTLNVREPGSPVSHEVQILPREVAETADSRHDLYEKARDGDPQAAAELRAANADDWNKFQLRQQTANSRQPTANLTPGGQPVRLPEPENQGRAVLAESPEQTQLGNPRQPSAVSGQPAAEQPAPGRPAAVAEPARAGARGAEQAAQPAGAVRWKAGRQNTPVEVRDDKGEWQQGTLKHWSPGYNGLKPQGRVELANGQTLRGVPQEDLRAPGRNDQMPARPGAETGPPVGPPIPGRLRQIQEAMAAGTRVTLYTARANDPRVAAWANEHGLGKAAITDVKGPDVGWILDDHSNVKPNVDEPFKIPPIEEGKSLYVDLDKTLAYTGEQRTADSGQLTAVSPQPSAGVKNAEEARTTTSIKAPTDSRQPESEALSNAGQPSAQTRTGRAEQSGANSSQLTAKSPAEQEVLRIARFTKAKDAAKGRGIHENAAAARPEMVDVAGRQSAVLDPDSAVLWHRAFAKFKDSTGWNPLGVGEDWLGITLDPVAAKLGTGFLKLRAAEARQEGRGTAADGYDRMAKTLTAAKAEDGLTTVLRGDYRDDTAREEAWHAWALRHDLMDSDAVRGMADHELVQTAVKYLQKSGYGGGTGGLDAKLELAHELLAKSLAGDPEMNEEHRVDAAHAFLTAAVDEFGPEILDDAPPADAAGQRVLNEIRNQAAREAPYGGGYDQRVPEGVEPEAREDIRPGRGEAGTGAGGIGAGGGTREPGEKRPAGAGAAPSVKGAGKAEGELASRRVSESASQPLPPTRESPLFAGTEAGGMGSLFQKSSGSVSASVPSEIDERNASRVREIRDRAKLEETLDRTSGKDQKTLPYGGPTAWQRALGAFRQWRDQTPTPATELKGQIREQLGEMHRNVLQLQDSLKAARAAFVGVSEEKTIQLIDDVEHGRYSAIDAEHRPIMIGLHNMLEEDRLDLQKLDPEKLKDFYENYFPHMWDQSGKVARQIQSQSKSVFGPGSFLQHRTLYPPTFKEGIDIGLRPKSWNPVDMALAKHAEIRKYIFGLQTTDWMKDAGIVKMYSSTKDVPVGWQPLAEPFGQVIRRADVIDRDKIEYATYNKINVVNRPGPGPAHRYDVSDANPIPSVAREDIEAATRPGRELMGHLYAPADAAKVFNNFVSKGLRGKNSVLDAAFGLNNGMNRVQLGLSAFHGVASTLHAAVNDIGMGLMETTQGRVGAAATTLGRAAVPGASMARAELAGTEMMKEYLNPGSAAKYAAEVSWMARAGGMPGQGLNLEPTSMRKVADAFAMRDPERVAKNALPAALEASSNWLLGPHGAIVRLKMGMFQMEASNILKQAEAQGWADGEVRTRMQKAWDSIDNRYGQLIYENLFAKRWALDLAQLGVRSVGWNLGSAREYFGGASDTARAAARVLARKRPEFTTRMAFTLATPIYFGMATAAMDYLINGKGPDTEKHGLKAYFYPEMPDGSLMSWPGYMKDWFSFGMHPVQTVLNKTSPLVNAVAEQWENKDYYGNQIRNEDDPLVKQLWTTAESAARQAVPFTFRSVMEQRRRAGEGEFAAIGGKRGGGMGMLAYAGFQPAPKQIQNSAAMNQAQHYIHEMPEGPRTEESMARSRKMHNLVEALREGNLDESKLDTVSAEEYRRALRQAHDAPIVTATRRLSLEQALHVWQKANAQEREALQEVMVEKAAKGVREAAVEKGDEAAKDLMARLEKAGVEY